jgi:hypothetical protein
MLAYRRRRPYPPSIGSKEDQMNVDIFNMELRKFLKRVGVTSQREIEAAVNAAIESGKLTGTEKIKTRMTLTIEALDVDHKIDGEISLS